MMTTLLHLIAATLMYSVSKIAVAVLARHYPDLAFTAAFFSGVLCIGVMGWIVEATR